MGNYLVIPQTASLESLLGDLPEKLSLDQMLGYGRCLKALKCSSDRRFSYVMRVHVKGSMVAPDDRDRLHRRIEKTRNRMTRMIELCSRLRMPHIQPYLRLYDTTKGAFIIRQYFTHNLAERMASSPSLTLLERLWIAYQLIAGVVQSHALGFVHQDIKSENVMLTSWNWVVLTDFASHKPAYLPMDNPFLFSYFYDNSGRRACSIAPERFYLKMKTSGPKHIHRGFPVYGKPREKLSPKCDIFSLGCVLAELMLEGQALFTYSQLMKFIPGNGGALCMGLEYDPVPLIKHIPVPGLEQMIMQMVSPYPEDRPSADAVLSTLLTEGVFPSYFPAMHDYIYAGMYCDVDVRLCRMRDDVPMFCEWMGLPCVLPPSPTSTQRTNWVDARRWRTVSSRYAPNLSAENAECEAETFDISPTRSAQTPMTLFMKSEAVTNMISGRSSKSGDVKTNASPKSSPSAKSRMGPNVESPHSQDRVPWRISSEVLNENMLYRLYSEEPEEKELDIPSLTLDDFLALFSDSGATGFEILADILCGSARHTRTLAGSFAALDLLAWLGGCGGGVPFLTDEFRRTRVLSCAIGMLGDPRAAVRAAAVRVCTDILSRLRDVGPLGIGPFIGPIVSALSVFHQERSEPVLRQACASVLHPLMRLYTIWSNATNFASTLQSNGSILRTNPFLKARAMAIAASSSLVNSDSDSSLKTSSQSSGPEDVYTGPLRRETASLLASIDLKSHKSNPTQVPHLYNSTAAMTSVVADAQYSTKVQFSNLSNVYHRLLLEESYMPIRYLLALQLPAVVEHLTDSHRDDIDTFTSTAAMGSADPELRRVCVDLRLYLLACGVSIHKSENTSSFTAITDMIRVSFTAGDKALCLHVLRRLTWWIRTATSTSWMTGSPPMISSSYYSTSCVMSGCSSYNLMESGSSLLPWAREVWLSIIDLALPLLLSPSRLIRDATVIFVDACLSRFSVADAYTFVLPRLQPYAKRPLRAMTPRGLLGSVWNSSSAAIHWKAFIRDPLPSSLFPFVLAATVNELNAVTDVEILAWTVAPSADLKLSQWIRSHAMVTTSEKFTELKLSIWLYVRWVLATYRSGPCKSSLAEVISDGLSESFRGAASDDDMSSGSLTFGKRFLWDPLRFAISEVISFRSLAPLQSVQSPSSLFVTTMDLGETLSLGDPSMITGRGNHAPSLQLLGQYYAASVSSHPSVLAALLNYAMVTASYSSKYSQTLISHHPPFPINSAMNATLPATSGTPDMRPNAYPGMNGGFYGDSANTNSQNREGGTSAANSAVVGSVPTNYYPGAGGMSPASASIATTSTAATAVPVASSAFTSALSSAPLIGPNSMSRASDWKLLFGAQDANSIANVPASSSPAGNGASLSSAVHPAANGASGAGVAANGSLPPVASGALGGPAASLFNNLASPFAPAVGLITNASTFTSLGTSTASILAAAGNQSQSLSLMTSGKESSNWTGAENHSTNAPSDIGITYGEFHAGSLPYLLVSTPSHLSSYMQQSLKMAQLNEANSKERPAPIHLSGVSTWDAHSLRSVLQCNPSRMCLFFPYSVGKQPSLLMLPQLAGRWVMALPVPAFSFGLFNTTLPSYVLTSNSGTSNPYLLTSSASNASLSSTSGQSSPATIATTAGQSFISSTPGSGSLAGGSNVASTSVVNAATGTNASMLTLHATPSAANSAPNSSFATLANAAHSSAPAAMSTGANPGSLMALGGLDIRAPVSVTTSERSSTSVAANATNPATHNTGTAVLMAYNAAVSAFTAGTSTSPSNALPAVGLPSGSLGGGILNAAVLTSGTGILESAVSVSSATSTSWISAEDDFPHHRVPRLMPDMGTLWRMDDGTSVPLNGSYWKDWKPSGTLIAHMHEHTGAIRAVRAAQDNMFFASASDDGTVKIWDCLRLVRNVTCRSRLTYVVAGGSARALAVCEGGHAIAAAADNGTIQVFRVDYTTKKEGGALLFRGVTNLRLVDTRLEGAIVAIENVSCASGVGSAGVASPSMLSWCTEAGYIHFWDMRQRNESFVLSMAKSPWLSSDPSVRVPTSLAIDPSLQCAMVGSGREVCCWDLRFQIPISRWTNLGDDHIRNLKLIRPGSMPLVCSAISNNLTGNSPSSEGQYSSGEISGPSKLSNSRKMTDKSRHLDALNADLEGDGRLSQITSLVAVAAGNKINFVDMLTGQSRASVVHNGVRALRWQSSSPVLFSAGSDRRLVRWEGERGRELTKTVVSQPAEGLSDVPLSNESAVVCTVPRPPATYHHDAILDIELLELPARIILTGSRDGVVKAWQ